MDAYLRGIKLQQEPPDPEPEEHADEPIIHADPIVEGDPPTKGPFIHLPARIRNVFHRHGIKTIKQLRALIATGKLTHTTYRNYGRTSHKAVLKAFNIQPTCRHCGQTIKTK